MDDTPKSSGLNLAPNDRKDEFLSASSLKQHEESSTRGRSSSISPSLRSFTSGTTEVYTEPISVPVSKKRRFKKITTTGTVKLSISDILKCLNPFNKTARTVPVTVEIMDDGSDADSDEYDIERPTSFIKDVFVLSNEKDWCGRYIQKQARCVIDTGNHQGNIVSKEFLVNVLKFPESTFVGQKLKKSDKEGVSVTGHTLIPEGAILLDWYHVMSTQRYRGMRFLVSPNPLCDLIIGAHSIEKHGILAPPNLSNSVVFKDWNTDYTYQEYKIDLGKLNNDLDTLKLNLKDAKKAKKELKINDLNTKIEAKQKEIDASELNFKHYEATQKLKEDPTNIEKQDEVEKLKMALHAAQKLLPNQPSASNAPQVIITDHNGQQRTSTGLSARTVLRPRTRAK